jgi:hypothetical protein
MADEKEVERVAEVIVNATRDDYGAPLVSSTAARHAARAVLSAIPSYAQGWDDAKRRAVEAVRRQVLLYGVVKDDVVCAAIRAIEPEKGTHEERWAAAGWPFKWSDDVRAYVCPVGDITGLPSLPTVQAVDAWIAAHGKGE